MSLKFKCHDCIHIFEPTNGDTCALCVWDPTHPNYKPREPRYDKYAEIDNGKQTGCTCTIAAKHIDFKCPDCLYWGVSMYDSPCSECFMTSTRPKFVPMYKEENVMVKTCITCAHRELPGSKEPCASCKRGNGDVEDRFEPATEKKEEEEKMRKDQAEDKVNHPTHYNTGEIEVIKYIQDKLGCEEFTGFCIGNVVKYVSRWRHKDGKQDLEKAKVYLQWAIESANRELEGKKNGTEQGD